MKQPCIERQPREQYGFIAVMLIAPLVLAGSLLMGSTGFGLPPPALRHEILSLRLTRLLAGLIVGGALSCSGTVFQAVLRNPLAEPFVLGVSSGAGLGAAIAILTGLCVAGTAFVPLAAFMMASLTLLLVYLLARQDRGPSLYSLILSGVIVSSICSSLLMFLVSAASIEGMHSILWWMLGNLEVTSRPMLATAGAVTLLGSFALWAFARELDALTLGHQMAHFLGVRVKRVLIVALVFATLMAATAVALAGLIGFVGLVVPHMLRTLVGPDHRRLLPAAVVGGGAFLALCDGVARSLLPVEIPVGVVTALLGGPFFLVLLRSRRTTGWSG